MTLQYIKQTLDSGVAEIERLRAENAKLKARVTTQEDQQDAENARFKQRISSLEDTQGDLAQQLRRDRRIAKDLLEVLDVIVRLNEIGGCVGPELHKQALATIAKARGTA